MRLLITCLILFIAMPALAAQTSRQHSFTIEEGGKDVGFHTVVIDCAGNACTATTEIAITYRLGPIVLYRYRHNSVEQWQDNQLISLNSKTNDDGTHYFVQAARQAGGIYSITNQDGTYDVPAPLAPTSYWNKKTVSGVDLLDTQNGTIRDVNVSKDVNGNYTLGGDLRLSIAYDRNYLWQGLSFTLKDRTFTYVPTSQALTQN